MHINFLKKTMLTSIVLFSSAFADQHPLALIGGANLDSGAAYAAFISSLDVETPINIGIANGTINSVHINVSGQGIIGGQDFNAGAPYAALVSPSGTPTVITPLPGSGAIASVALNTSGRGIIGGTSGAAPYAAVVSPSGVATPITIGIAMGSIKSVALNNSGQGIIGGNSIVGAGPAYAAFVSSLGVATPIATGLIGGIIEGVGINSSGQAIIGGRNYNNNNAYAALVSSSNVVTPLATGLPNGFIFSAAINASGQGVIGGQNTVTNAAYAAVVSPLGVLTQISTGINGRIHSVAINDSGQGIIGGERTFVNIAYAAFVSPSGDTTLISPLPSAVTINSVAINAAGQGVIGGSDDAYAAIVSPSGIATPINLSVLGGLISGVSIGVATILPLLSNIPTGSLSGNNLRFANYINKYAPQDAFYFVPAIFDGTLAQALESAAPTRNAFSLYTASNNLFYLNTSLSNHLHNRSMQRRGATPHSAIAFQQENRKSDDQLLASLSLPKPKIAAQASDTLAGSMQKDPPSDDQLLSTWFPYQGKQTIKQREEEVCEEKNNSIWVEAIGALAYQKAQNQTPVFNPTTGGAILAYDGKTSQQTRVGAGAAYLYTHIHEKKDAGHSNINQEDLFVYATWENKQFYIDGSLIGGLFQISQVRNIHMTGFDFKSKSHPHGWQLLPHLELGYHYTRPHGTRLTINPFVMVDWANAWQHHYKEKGSGPFNAGQKSHYSSLLRTEASLRMYETVFFDCWNLIFQEKVGYVNVHSFKTGRVNAFLVGSPGAFTVTTLTADQNLGVAEFAMIFAPDRSVYPTGTIFYQGEFGVKYQSHQVGLELAWNF